jgi:GT2 family glycosyltransferase
MTKVAIVILNFNGEKLLRQFLPSVLQHSPQAEVIVADNGSTDDSIIVLKKEFPSVRLITLEKNFGFCGGYNRALQQVDADVYVILNSDIEVTPGWLVAPVALLERDKTIAAVQPKIISYREKNKFEYAGAAGGFIDTLGYPFCRGRVFDHVEEDRGQYNDEREIFWATGACLIIRSSVFRQFKGFDEDFFAHMEEIDLCWKIIRSNQKVFYCGSSTVFHLGAGTLAYDNPRKTYLNFRNGLALIYKHFTSVELIFKLPTRILLDWLAAFMFLLKGKSKNATAVFHAHRDFFRAWRVNRVKRRINIEQYPSYPRRSIHPGLIIFDYYLRKKKTVEVSSPR